MWRFTDSKVFQNGLLFLKFINTTHSWTEKGLYVFNMYFIYVVITALLALY